MPATGLGTGGYGHYYHNMTEVTEAVTAWLAAGGRRIDASLSYEDQVGVAAGIKASGVPREQVSGGRPAGSVPGPPQGAWGCNVTWTRSCRPSTMGIVAPVARSPLSSHLCLICPVPARTLRLRSSSLPKSAPFWPWATTRRSTSGSRFS